MCRKDIKPSEKRCVDYIPEDHQLCSRCVFCMMCPYDYECETYKRNKIAEWMENVCDGDSA